MLPYINILNKQLPMYGIIILIALLITILMSLYNTKYNGIKKRYILICLAVSITLGVLGANIYYIVTHIEIYDNIKKLTLGMSFIGFLIGAIIGVILFCKIEKVRIDKFLSIILPSMILFYGIAKVGCFCAGCCYGIRLNQNTLLPIQLIESIYNIIIYIYLTFMYKRCSECYKILGYTCILFGIGKFVFTFFRGDFKTNTEFFSLALSQFILLIIIIIGIYIKNKKWKGFFNE